LNIPYEDLRDWQLLGKGRTAKVFRARLYGSWIAVKIPRNQKKKQQQNPNLAQENFMRTLREGVLLKYACWMRSDC
jgi:predicted Ser/Thr protein kinase